MSLDPQNRAEIAAFVREEGRAVVATVTSAGEPEAALVDIAVDDEGAFFFTARNIARKLDNLRANPKAAMVIGTTSDVSLQLEGPAHVAEGEEKAYLVDAFMAQYPTSRAEHEDFEMVVIRPNWVRHYDASTRPPTVAEVNW
jgi:pyridoxine/pyridoxamine 5'-phosphate oxidase